MSLDSNDSVGELNLDPPTPNPEKKAAPTQNFQQTVEYTTHDLGDKFDVRQETAFMPSASASAAREVIDDLPQAGLGSDAKSQDWLSNLNSGQTAVPFNGGLEATVEREGAMFVQEVQAPSGKLHGGSPRFVPKEGVKPTGEAARFHIRAALGMGGAFVAPLYHSGFWVTIKAPGEDRLLELYRQITAEKISLGRATYGYLFSNATAYTTRIMLDFVLDHLYDTSVKDVEADKLRELIRIPDLQILIWAMACATWPSGFQYQRSCVADPEKCHHVVHEKLNLAKLLWTDTNALTERQVAHMAKRQRGSVTLEEVKRYVDEFIRGQDQLVQVTDDLAIVLKVPNAMEHIEAGYNWVNTIEEMYARVLTQDEKTRDDYLMDQGRATAMRQYAHLVKAIKVGDIEYEERDVIQEALNDLTSRDDVRTKFLEKARDFLDQSIVSLVAIPTFTCPSCGGHQTGEAHRHYPELIPLDVQQTFFQVLVQRLQKIRDR